MGTRSSTVRPPAHAELARLVVRDVVVECERALESPTPETGVRAAVHAGLVALGELGTDDPSTQLRAIEFEADRVDVYGFERIRARLAYARALLKL